MTESISKSWLTFPKRSPNARFRLFCFPYAGGGPSVFRSWADKVSPDIEICSIQLPGRQGRALEAPVTRLDLMVETLARAMSPHLDRPFAFFGHSMGALISFELARHLRRELGFEPVHLFVSAQRAPHLPKLTPNIHLLPEDTFIAWLHYLNGIPGDVLQNGELMQLILPALRADVAICEMYVYSADHPLNCSISGFGGLQDWTISYYDLLAWRQYALGAFKLRFYPGDHFFVETSAQFILGDIASDLTGN